MSKAQQALSEKELCPEDLLAGQEAAFARDIARLQARRAAFVLVDCPACGGAAREAAFSKFGFDFARCTSCATLYMTPRPSAAVMAEYYANSENYEYWAAHIFPASEAVRREKIHKPWLDRVTALCARHGIARGTLVEVGPGFGTFAALAGDAGAFARVLAIEPTPQMAAACRARGVAVIEKRIEEVGDELGTIDVLVAFEVIEHLFAPRVFLEQCARLLRPGGLLVLSCPNGQGFDITMLGSKALAVDAEHVNLFNPASLSHLVGEHGFSVLEVTTPGRLDAEFVREAALKGDIALDPFQRRVLIEEWERLGHAFQQFLAENGLSSHMWLAARRRGGGA
ncbi:MAG: class I SAM-dependent methyltransferase [Alphaproteobacteria bacterium]|nr:class I SAM-dependent methyltransferase [Alphaproteobacteria bacterium]